MILYHLSIKLPNTLSSNFKLYLLASLHENPTFTKWSSPVYETVQKDFYFEEREVGVSNSGVCPALYTAKVYHKSMANDVLMYFLF